MTTKYRPSTDQVEVEEYFEDKNYDELVSKEQEVKNEEFIKVEEVNPPKKLSYKGRNGGSLRFDRL